MISMLPLSFATRITKGSFSILKFRIVADATLPKCLTIKSSPDVVLGGVDSPRDHVEQALLVAAVGDSPTPGDEVLREQPQHCFGTENLSKVSTHLS